MTKLVADMVRSLCRELSLEERLDCFVEHIWPDCKVDFDAGKPFEPQIRALVDGLGYLPDLTG
ncbi:MAG TPA: hypothetical protein GXX40_01555 [Firmicutes bacterium]|nr:hypothetical protein [Bacillota bacterium]